MKIRIKKRVFTRLRCTLFLLLGALPLISCSSSDDDGGDTSVVFTVNKTDLSYTSNGGDATFSVRAGTKPNITSSADWCTVTLKSTGSNIYNYVVTTQTYVGNAATMTNYDDREATITVNAGSDSQTIKIVQTPEYGLFVTSLKTVSVDENGGSVTISLKSNSSNYSVEVDNTDMLEIPSGTRATLSDYTCTINVTKNISGERTGKVSFTLGNVTESVSITQNAGSSSSDMSMTAVQIAKDMYPGWNLGNTMEAGNSANNNTNNGGLSSETSWQSTKTSQAVIDLIAAKGFKSVRIPCSWICGHIVDAENSTIDAAWMERVQAIVDYCIKKNLYVIINDHYDGGWLEQSFSDVSDDVVTKNSAKLKAIWTQIANNFKDYDEHLLFAGLNEPGMNEISEFNASKAAALLKYEQTFVDAVRATGGNNAKRVLVVQGPLTNIDQTCKYLDVTKITDVIADRMMVEVHFYEPWQFSGLEEDASWGKVYYYWGVGNAGDADRTTPTNSAETYVNAQFAKMKTQYADKGYPVIIGEYGANYRFKTDDKHNASIKAFYEAVNQYAINNGCIPFAWDTNYTGLPNMTIIDRSKLTVNNSYMMDGIISGVNKAVWPY